MADHRANVFWLAFIFREADEN